MGDEALYLGLDDNDDVRDAIQYLNNNKTKLVQDAISMILDNTKATYLKRLNRNLKKFEHSIIGEKGHIQWILKDLYNPEEIDFANYNASFVKDTPQAYCDFYKNLIDLTKNVDKDTKEILHDQFNAFSEMYCLED